MRVLVTGGTGYLGAAIVRALARDGHAPVVFARRASRSDLPGAAVDGDVRDRAAVMRAARGADAICHTAALVSVWRPRRDEFDEINVGGVRTIVDVCQTLRIPRLVYTSSFLARPPEGARAPMQANDYQRTKVAALDVARRAAASGVPIVTLVPGVVYGPGTVTEGNLVDRLVRDHLAGRLPGLVGADRVWSFAYVDDVASAHVAALTAAPGGELVVGGENAPQMRLFEILHALMGVRLPRRLPFPVATLAACLEEARARLFRQPPLVTRGVVEIFRQNWPLDSQPAAAALGYRPRSLQEGLTLTFQPDTAGRGAR